MPADPILIAESLDKGFRVGGALFGRRFNAVSDVSLAGRARPRWREYSSGLIGRMPGSSVFTPSPWLASQMRMARLLLAMREAGYNGARSKWYSKTLTRR